MNGKPVREIPIVPRREDKPDEADGCTCDAPVPEHEQTADEDLPEALVPGLDRPKARKGER